MEILLRTLRKGKNQMPSLRQLALVGTASVIFDEDDIKVTLLKKYPKFHDCLDLFQFQREERTAMESKLAKKVLKLGLPESLTEDMLDLVWPMTLEIFHWTEYCFLNTGILMDLQRQFCWTWQGNIDKKRTAKMLVRDERIAVERRYRLACLHCLDEDIPVLWDQIDADQQNIFLGKDDWVGFTESEIVIFWSNYIQIMPISISDFTFEEVLREATKDGNVAATNYFLSKISTERKQDLSLSVIRGILTDSIVKMFTRFLWKDDEEVFYILLCQMEIEALLVFVRESPFTILYQFLYNGREILFTEMADQMWGFLNEQCFALLLTGIFNKYRRGYKSVYYRKLFVDFWEKSPGDYKRFVNTDSEYGAEMLFQFLIYRFTFCRKIRTFKQKTNRFCKLLKIRNSRPPYGFNEDNWKFLKIFMQERISTKHSLTLFKEIFMATPSYVSNKAKCDKQLYLVDRVLSDEI